MTDNYTYAKRIALAALVIILIVLGFYLLGKYAYFFLLVFAGILLAVLFCGMTDWIVRKTNMKRWIALVLSVLFFFGLITGAIMLVAPTIGEQVSQMQETLPQALKKVKDWLSQRSWGEKMIDQMPTDLSSISEHEDIASQLTGVFSSTLSFVTDLFIVIITALFFASNPSLYTKGLVKLFSVKARPRMYEVLQKCYDTLRMWLLAMLAAMALIGISTAIGYSLIGLPLAFALALIAFLFAFIPNIGPYIAGIPAVLIGLLEGPEMALTVILVYGGIQMVESWIITPIIFEKTVALPPALLLFFQVLLGIMQGALGLLMAAPLLAVLMVVVNELYIKDVLEKKQKNSSAEASFAAAQHTGRPLPPSAAAES